jgi:hypothetical protein
MESEAHRVSLSAVSPVSVSAVCSMPVYVCFFTENSPACFSTENPPAADAFFV